MEGALVLLKVRSVKKVRNGHALTTSAEIMI
jgi:hypothetical protein